MLETIKRMAVLVSNPMVQRNQMRDHRQVLWHVARVWEAAIDCNFEMQYNGDSSGRMVSYKEEITRGGARLCLF